VRKKEKEKGGKNESGADSAGAGVAINPPMTVLPV
jgi:hypothetical protein